MGSSREPEPTTRPSSKVGRHVGAPIVGDESAAQPHVPWREALGTWAKIGCLGFGGPAGQIALMHRILVEEKRWIGEARFLHALNYCMLLPGPEAQQLATYVGWLLHRTARRARGRAAVRAAGRRSCVLALSVLYARYQDAAALVDGAVLRASRPPCSRSWSRPCCASASGRCKNALHGRARGARVRRDLRRCACRFPLIVARRRRWSASSARAAARLARRRRDAETGAAARRPMLATGAGARAALAPPRAAHARRVGRALARRRSPACALWLGPDERVRRASRSSSARPRW